MAPAPQTALPDITPYRTGKTVYLTFDDGPDDKNTPAVLDVLREAGVKATFYVTGRQAEAHPDVLQRIYDEGHAIGNHSYDHRYEKLYPDVNGFLAEMERTDEIIYGILGVRPLILRAPGGRIGHFTAAYAPAIRANGYVEHDWNVSSADAAPGHPVAQQTFLRALVRLEMPADTDPLIVVDVVRLLDAVHDEIFVVALEIAERREIRFLVSVHI